MNNSDISEGPVICVEHKSPYLEVFTTNKSQVFSPHFTLFAPPPPHQEDLKRLETVCQKWTRLLQHHEEGTGSLCYVYTSRLSKKTVASFAI